MNDTHCFNCGAEIKPGSPFCSRCGMNQYLQGYGGAAQQNMQSNGNPMQQNMQSYGSPMQQNMQNYAAPNQPYMPNAPKKNHTAAIIAICVTICVVVIGAVVAIVFGLSSRSSNESGQRASSSGRNNGSYDIGINRNEDTRNSSREETGHATIYYELPDGFTESSNMPGIYYGPDYPYDTSNVYVQSAEDDPMGTNYTEELIRTQLLLTYDAMGVTVTDLDFIEFTKGEMDGYDTLFIYFTYSLGEFDIVQIEFVIQIENTTHLLTYTTMAENDMIDSFLESVDSIRVVYE